LLLFATTLFAFPLHAQQAASTNPAPAKTAPSMFNKNLPGWIRFSGELRYRFEGLGGLGFKPDTNDAFNLTRARLNLKVSPSSWMRFQVQAVDSQVMGRNAKPDGPPYEDTFDLRQGYVELGSSDKPAITLRVGRQELFFGDMRLIGHLNWTNTARSFDAARVTLKYGKYKVDAFTSSVVNPREARFDKSASGNDLHGAYGSIEKVIPNATDEPYVFWRISHGVKTEGGIASALSRWVYGDRIAGKLPAEHLDYTFEMVGEAGFVGSDTIRAYAGHWLVGYTVPKIKKTTRLIAQYDYASGDKTAGDGKQETFDQLYPTGHDKLGLSDQVGWKNIHDVRAGMEYKATKKLSLNSSYHAWWLASRTDALYNAAGAVIVKVAAGTAGRFVGQEADIQTTYALRPDLSLTGGFANVFPGTFLKNATPGKPYRFSYVMATYSF